MLIANDGQDGSDLAIASDKGMPTATHFAIAFSDDRSQPTSLLAVAEIADANGKFSRVTVAK